MRPRVLRSATALSQLSITMKSPAKHTPVNARRPHHTGGEMKTACASGATTATLVNAANARM
jgi:hypothetical protein